MKQKYFIPIAVAALIGLAAGTVFAGGKSKTCSSCSGTASTAVTVEEKSQTQCPVMGESVNKEIYVDHDGKRVYFCCEACVETFKKDPDTYLEKLKKDGVKLEATPKAVQEKTS
jgi:YHS domain-containing protein